MFTTIRVKWRKVTFCFLCVAVVCLLGFNFTDKLSEESNADTMEKRTQIAKQYGFDITKSEENIDTVLVPDSESDSFKKYSKLLSESGFDIGRFSGLALTRYSYDFTQDGLRLNLLVCNGNLIGADLFDLNNFEYLSIGVNNGIN